MELIDEDSVRRVTAFVNEGGVLVTFGAAIRLLERYDERTLSLLL